MADVKISNLPEVTTLNTADVAPFVSSGVTSKITLQNIAANMPQVSSSISASNALTASYIDAANVVGLNLSQIASGSATASITPGLFNVNTNTNVQGNLTASNALFTGAIIAQTLVVQTVSSSIIYSSGSNTFGDELTDIQQFTGSVRITGSLTVDGPLNAPVITGSLFGTASWALNTLTASFVTASNVWGPFGSNSVISSSYALTASFALNAASLSTTQIATGSVTASVNINSASFQVVSGSTNLLFVSNSGLITAQRLFLSSSRNMASGSTLVVFGSGSAQPVFTVQGSQGELFSVNDSLSGSLFSVNDISGLPIIEAFSDNRVLIGSYQAPMLTTTVRTTLAVGNNIIYQNIPTASYDAVFFEYSLKSGSNARAGSIMGIWSGSDANYNETVTVDFGDTTGVKFMVMVTGSNVALTGSATTANWTMKTIIRSI